MSLTVSLTNPGAFAIPPLQSAMRISSTTRSLLLVLLVMLLTSCAPPEPIRIGLLGNLTGRNADLGLAGRNGALLAIEQANARGGIKGRSIEMVIRDDENKPETVAPAIAQLQAEGVVAVIGPMLSVIAMAAAPATEKAGLPMISPTVTTTQLSGKDDLFFKVAANTREHTRLSVNEQYRRGMRRVAAVQDVSNRAYTDDWLRDFREGFEALGGQLVGVEPINSGQAEGYAEAIKRLGALQADGLMLISNALDTVQLLQLARKQGLSQPAFGSTWAGTEQLLELGGRTVEGFMVSQYFDRNDDSPEYRAFRDAYLKRFNQSPGFASVAGYDAVQAVLTAIGQQKDGQSLKQSLLANGPYRGAQQQWRFNSFGDADRRAYLSVVTDGKFVTLD